MYIINVILYIIYNFPFLSIFVCSRYCKFEYDTIISSISLKNLVKVSKIRMDTFGIRLYQSGKTRRRNANKKRQLERYRQMIAEERKVEAIEHTTMEHENISKPVQEQNVDLVDDISILKNTTVTFGQWSIDNCPEFYNLSSSIQMKPNNAQIQRDEFNPIEIMGVKYQSFAENVVSLFPNRTPIVFPPKLEKDDAIHVEDDEIKG